MTRLGTINLNIFINITTKRLREREREREREGEGERCLMFAQSRSLSNNLHWSIIKNLNLNLRSVAVKAEHKYTASVTRSAE